MLAVGVNLKLVALFFYCMLLLAVADTGLSSLLDSQGTCWALDQIEELFYGAIESVRWYSDRPSHCIENSRDSVERAAESWYAYKRAGRDGAPINAIDIIAPQCRAELFPVDTAVQLGAPEPGSHPGLGFYSSPIEARIGISGYVLRTVDGLWAQVPGMSCAEEAVIFASASLPCALLHERYSTLRTVGASHNWADIPPVSTLDALRAHLPSHRIELRRFVLVGRSEAERVAFDSDCAQALRHDTSLFEISCTMLLLNGEPLVNAAAVARAFSPVDSPSVAAALVHMSGGGLCLGRGSTLGSDVWDTWLEGRVALATSGDGQPEEGGGEWLVQARRGCGLSCVEGAQLEPPEGAAGVIYAVRRHDGRVRTAALERVQRIRRY